MSTSADPHRQLTRRVLSVPGVVQVFPPTPASIQLSAAESGTRHSKQSGWVEVKETPNGIRITAKIATVADEPAPETAGRVADALLDAAAPNTTVKVQIAHIG